MLGSLESPIPQVNAIPNVTRVAEPFHVVFVFRAARNSARLKAIVLRKLDLKIGNIGLDLVLLGLGAGKDSILGLAKNKKVAEK